MDLYTKIRMLCAVKGISMAELARRAGDSPQNFSAKLKRGSFTVGEFNRIAKAADTEFEYCFITKDGDRI